MKSFFKTEGLSRRQRLGVAQHPGRAVRQRWLRDVMGDAGMNALFGVRREVDPVAEIGGLIIPFEVKYRAQHTAQRDLKGLLELCQQKSIDRGYVVTKSLDDFGVIPDLQDTDTRILRIPAPLLCYWMGESELTRPDVAE